MLVTSRLADEAGKTCYGIDCLILVTPGIVLWKEGDTGERNIFDGAVTGILGMGVDPHLGGAGRRLADGLAAGELLWPRMNGQARESDCTSCERRSAMGEASCPIGHRGG